ncbi:hypothetical protein [Methylocystis sp.]|uniref:hypothetical protein n=1 Tax=Methylocystis sp. TaxID=1911079 RepID=UPI003DA5502F
MSRLARIHRQNLINYGILPLLFAHNDAYDRLQIGDKLNCENLRSKLANGEAIVYTSGNGDVETVHHLTPEEIAVIIDGGVIAHRRLLGHMHEASERRSA